MQARAEYRNGAWSLVISADDASERAILAQMSDLGNAAHTTIGSSYSCDLSAVTEIVISWIESKP